MPRSEAVFIFFFFLLETNYSTGPLVIQLHHAVVNSEFSRDL